MKRSTVLNVTWQKQAFGSSRCALVGGETLEKLTMVVKYKGTNAKKCKCKKTN